MNRLRRIFTYLRTLRALHQQLGGAQLNSYHTEILRLTRAGIQPHEALRILMRINSPRDAEFVERSLQIVDLTKPEAFRSLAWLHEQVGSFDRPLEDIQNRNWYSYSQEGEDLILARLLSQPQGFYVDVGAHHPFRFSNTHAFYERGWTGINIEPDPEGFEALQRHRPHDINLNFAVLSETGRPPGVFYRFNESALNTFDAQYAAEMEKKGYQIRERRTVATRSLAAIFAEYRPAGDIDLMSVDCEGVDLEVLESNDWSRWRPKALVVEVLTSENRLDESAPITAFLLAQGYRLYSLLLNSRIFVDTKGKS